MILLKPIDELPGEGRILPIWIGAQEATSILIAVEGALAPRPLAHDLMKSMLDALQATVEQVEVTRIDDGTFFAAVTLRSASGVLVIDARPSDAVALASRAGAPVFVAEAVLLEAGVPGTVVESDEEQSLEEFQRFLDEVDPEDFREG